MRGRGEGTLAQWRKEMQAISIELISSTRVVCRCPGNAGSVTGDGVVSAALIAMFDEPSVGPTRTSETRRR